MDIRSLSAPVIQDRSALEEFAEALTDLAPRIENDVALLRKTPAERDMIADLFRAVHNVKGDAALCKFELGVAIAHPIESMMSRFRDGELPFSDLLAELILLAIDRLELATEALLGGRPLTQLHLEELVRGMERLADELPEAIELRCAELIEAVTGFPPVIGEISARQPSGSGSPSRQASDLSADLTFFRALALQLESRSPLFKGRTMRILRLALETNRAGGQVVDPLQLEAAVYLHDLGMMLLPESVWLKVGKLAPEETLAMRKHPGYGAGLLERIPGWAEAARIVAQHHEMPDGAGYPQGLADAEIVAGAKILAIVDAFEAVMLKHIHRGRNRSVLRAIAEINACDRQFAPEWIAPFNQVIRKTMEH